MTPTKEKIPMVVSTEVSYESCKEIIDTRSFINYFNEVAFNLDDIFDYCHQAAVGCGWWHIFNVSEGIVEPTGKLSRNVGELYALIHSEVSEAFEGARKSIMSEKIPEFTSEEEEIADLLIRIGDYATARKLRISGAIVAKLNYNLSRDDHKPENRMKAGGKQV